MPAHRRKESEYEKGLPDRCISSHMIVLVSVREAAIVMACSPQTVRRRIAAGCLSAYRHGRIVRLDQDEVIRYITGHRQAGAGTFAMGHGPRYAAGSCWWSD
jgi:excisionase family DNA binding protein